MSSKIAALYRAHAAVRDGASEPSGPSGHHWGTIRGLKRHVYEAGRGRGLYCLPALPVTRHRGSSGLWQGMSLNQ